MGKTRKGLTEKQEAFARNLIKTKGNQTEAAKLAGYSPNRAHVEGSELMLHPGVREALKRYRASAEARTEITTAKVIEGIAEIGHIALSSGELSTALKAKELLGRALGAFVDRTQSININVDATEAHLDALLRRAKERASEPLDITPNRTDG